MTTNMDSLQDFIMGDISKNNKKVRAMKRAMSSQSKNTEDEEAGSKNASSHEIKRRNSSKPAAASKMSLAKL
jgi:hypothetical protein